MSQEKSGFNAVPGADLDLLKMPAHWLLARMGKTVLRPGGLRLTRKLLELLDINSTDEVAEFAPGLGRTARLILDRGPESYIGIERDIAAKDWSERHLPSRFGASVALGSAENTGLPGESRSVVIGEAMMTMNPHVKKRQIIGEAFRLLKPAGRFGIHELCLGRDNHSHEIERDLQNVLKVGARPLSQAEWSGLLTAAGFKVRHIVIAPMDLLRPARVLEDEGWIGGFRIARNVIFNPIARRRVLAIARTLERHRSELNAIAIVAEKSSR